MGLLRPTRHGVALVLVALTVSAVAVSTVAVGADTITTPVSGPPGTIGLGTVPTTVAPAELARSIEIMPTKGKPGTVIGVNGDCGAPFTQVIAGLAPTIDNTGGPLVGGEVTIFVQYGDTKMQTFEGTLTVPAKTPSGTIYVGGLCWYPEGHYIPVVPFKVTGGLTPSFPWGGLKVLLGKVNTELHLIIAANSGTIIPFASATTTTTATTVRANSPTTSPPEPPPPPSPPPSATSTSSSTTSTTSSRKP